MDLRADAISIFNAAIKAVHPHELMKGVLHQGSDHLLVDGVAYPFDSFENLYVIGAGKAASAMAKSTEHFLGDLITEGFVITKHGHSLETEIIEIMEAGHPIPDEYGRIAIKKLEALLERIEPDDLVICLISGGASALWCDIPERLSLEDFQSAINLLINCGASISEINTVRKHLSTIKGGQLLKKTKGAKVISLVISDVPGDDLSVIASGPTTADSSTFYDALKVLKKYKLVDKVPLSIKEYLDDGANGATEETLKPNSPLFKDCRNILLGTNYMALNAAKQKAKSLGYNCQLNELLATGNTEIEAVQFCRNLFEKKQPRGTCIIQGGETTTSVTGTGKGGRNQHFTLTALDYLSRQTNSLPKFCILGGGTDGTDGPTDAAGGVIDDLTVYKVKSEQLNPSDYIKDFDAYHFLKKTDSLLVTGPTQTNVMDIMIGLIGN